MHSISIVTLFLYNFPLCLEILVSPRTDYSENVDYSLEILAMKFQKERYEDHFYSFCQAINIATILQPCFVTYHTQYT